MRTKDDVRVEQVYLLPAAAVPAVLGAGQVEQLAGDLLLRREHDAVLRQDAEHRAGVGDGLHGVFDCDRRGCGWVWGRSGEVRLGTYFGRDGLCEMEVSVWNVEGDGRRGCLPSGEKMVVRPDWARSAIDSFPQLWI
jgi:hypothetical protein